MTAFYELSDKQVELITESLSLNRGMIQETVERNLHSQYFKDYPEVKALRLAKVYELDKLTKQLLEAQDKNSKRAKRLLKEKETEN